MRTFPIATDLRDSTRVVREAAGRPAVAFDYDPFGHALAASGAPLARRITHRYAGKRWEPESGLQDFGARHYDAVLARFVSPDPHHQTPSPYAYCANDPVDCVDRDGRGFDRIQEVTVAGVRFLRAFKNDEQAEEDLPAEPPDIVLRFQPSMGVDAKMQFIASYGLLRRYVSPYLDTYGLERLSMSRFVKYGADDRRAVWQFAIQHIRDEGPMDADDAPIAARADDEEATYEAPGPELSSPSERSDAGSEAQSRTEKASSIAAEELLHDLPDDLPDLVDPDPEMMRSVVPQPQSPVATVPPHPREVAPPIAIRGRVVGRKLARSALKTLSRYAPYQTRPAALAALHRLSLRFLAPAARAEAYARARSARQAPPAQPDVEP